MKSTAPFWLIPAIVLVGCSTPDGTGGDLESSLSLLPPPNLTHGLVAFNTPTPLYPIRAQNLNLEGWVMLEFSVATDGSVVPSSIDTVQAQPAGYFESAAISAARRMRFDNSRNTVVEDVRWVFRFELEEEQVQRVVTTPEPDNYIEFRELIPMRYITPDYPPSARTQGTEGYVVVAFSVNEDGSVENVRIVEGNPSNVFEESALDAAMRLRFEPRIVLNNPVRVDDVEFRFDWALP
ncbi:MAG: energy transducer TonB [Pseudomonadales bacterium]|nr:energy transducer TonB [Pseudomonadales bacterium]